MPIKETAGTALLAVPAVAMLYAQYGWKGLAMLSGAILLRTALEVQNDSMWPKKVPSIDKLESRLTAKNANTEKIEKLIRAQKLCDELTSSIGMQRVKIILSDEPGTTQMTNREIWIEPVIYNDMNDGKNKWVIGHELDHFRNKDLLRRIPYKTAQLFNFIVGGCSAINIACDVPFNLTSTPDLEHVFAYGFLTWVSLKFSEGYRMKQEEYRCDSNALRMTGDFESAYNAAKDLPQDRETPSGFTDKFAAKICQCFSSHPSKQARLKNLSKTYQTMQQENLHAPSPLPMTAP